MPASHLQEIVCCMGLPVAGNPTQFMMERALAAAGLDWRYLTLEILPEKLGDAMRGLRAMGFKGANVISPHKVAIIPYLDSLSPAAELMGAVNCVQRVDEKLIGENTAGQALLRLLPAGVSPAGKKVLLLGAGLLARELAVEVGLAGAGEIVIVNRTAERGQALVDLLNSRVKVVARLVHLSGEYAVEEDTQLVVNATAIGWGDAEAPVPLAMASLKPEMLVADVTFNPPQTRFLREAAAHGCQTIDGLGMLVHQGALSFKVWTGLEPDPGVMREALEEYLEI